MYQLNPELEHLRAQQERDQKKLEQLQHRAQRLQNRINYLESAERRQRNHRLITRGAAVEHLWPEVKPLTEHEYYVLMEQVTNLPAARSIRSTNAAIRSLRKKIADLLSWLSEVKEVLSKPKSPKLTDILAAYYGQRNAGAWSNKAKAGNLKQYAETINYLMENDLYTVEDLEAYASGLYSKMDALRERINQAQSRSKEITDLLSFAEMYAETKPVFDQLNEIKFKKRREKFQAEHENELRRFYLARRKLKDHISENGKLPISAWRRELAGLEQTVSGIKAEHLPLREEWKKLLQVRTCVSNTLRQTEQSPRQKQHDHDVHL